MPQLKLQRSCKLEPLSPSLWQVVAVSLRIRVVREAEA